MTHAEPTTRPDDRTVAEVRARLAHLTLRDERRLERRISGLRTLRDPQTRRRRLSVIESEVAVAERRIERRRAAVPPIRYPEELPVSARRTEIAAAIRDSQVVILAGETGSGKTTQLPKICLELGRGVRGAIGHTQPRRLAARTVAERIAEELGVPVGGAVGYSVRFTDRVGEDTLVKVMTDGILLAELQRDRQLEAYDTIIIDEAHERSLNVDFLLGYLRQLLPRRPDLKVIITSATIDPQRFSRHFRDAPVIEVSGRNYPVEVRYRPLSEAEGADRDTTDAVIDAVTELWLEGPGDVLVFLSGEREIRDTADALRRAELPDTDIVPLYARLAAAEQHRVFEPHAIRRVVLATNVAETSLTVPGIRYVVDPGLSRISRYSRRTKVQRLPIEAISRASARQRTGRCGRLGPGICLRLYTEADFESRPEFTDPEILRTNLASVLLQMAALGLGDISTFPFLDPPDRRAVRDGIALLEELGAFGPASADPGPRLTPLGRTLASLPVDPRFGRMLIEADRNGCLAEVLVIAAALSIPDPRERPGDQPAAAEKHGRFAAEGSDFLAYLQLWRYLREQQRDLSGNSFRKLCRSEFLNYLRVREWQDVHGQLRRIAEGLGLARNEDPADAQSVHRSLLAGLLSHVGVREGERREFLGARGARFTIASGSALAKKPPRWVMAAELVETARLYARVAARIEPEWAEQLAGDLAKRTYSEPHWERKRGGVVALEKVTLYGVPLVAARKVDYGRIDPGLARELFLRHALVEGDWETHHAFFAENRNRLEEVEEWENRLRRRDVRVDDETLFDFYDRRIPAEVVSARHFDAWWKSARRETPELLTLPPDLLLGNGGFRPEDYPDTWDAGGSALPLSYEFEPGSPTDGVTVEVPLAGLDRVSATDFDWQVPGLRAELVTALLRGLPKALRTSFVPAPDFAAAALADLRPRSGPLLESLSLALLRRTGVDVPLDAWRPDGVPAHLRITYRIVDEQRRTLATDKDLAQLRRRLRGEVGELLRSVAGDLERPGLRTWSVGTLPRFVRRDAGGYPVTGYPALVDEGATVGVRVLRTETEQRSEMWRGTRRLLTLNVPSPLRSVVGGLPNPVKLALAHNPHGGVPALLEDCVAAAVDRLLASSGGPAYDEAGFGTLLDAVRAELTDAVAEIVPVVADILLAAHSVGGLLSAAYPPALLPSVTDMQAQLGRLVYPGFITATGARRLADVARYVRAIEVRAQKLPERPERDRENLARVAAISRACADAVRRLPADPAVRVAAADIRWQIEEFRVSRFAQTLGTPQPVSEPRIMRALESLLD